MQRCQRSSQLRSCDLPALRLTHPGSLKQPHPQMPKNAAESSAEFGTKVGCHKHLHHAHHTRPHPHPPHLISLRGTISQKPLRKASICGRMAVVMRCRATALTYSPLLSLVTCCGGCVCEGVGGWGGRVGSVLVTIVAVLVCVCRGGGASGVDDGDVDCIGRGGRVQRVRWSDGWSGYWTKRA